MSADDLRAFGARDWSVADASKRGYWAERYRASAGEATWAASVALRTHMRQVRPDWPTQRDRDDDLAHHVELKRKLDCAAHVFTNR